MIRVRHYTRISAMQKILAARRIIARDQNKVFVELASDRRLPPADAEDKYDLDDGKGNAYVEFEIEPKRLRQQYNTRLRLREYYIAGDVDLNGRDPAAFFNIRGLRRWKPSP